MQTICAYLHEQSNEKTNNNNIMKSIQNDTHTHTRHFHIYSGATVPYDIGFPWIVLERPSSQMSYLDHFLKESGSTTNTTHTTSSTIAINMVSTAQRQSTYVRNLKLNLLFSLSIQIATIKYDISAVPRKFTKSVIDQFVFQQYSNVAASNGEKGHISKCHECISRCRR